MLKPENESIRGLAHFLKLEINDGPMELNEHLIFIQRFQKHK